MIADYSHDTAQARCLRTRLADRLTASGALAADWRPAFMAVPRHPFVPRIFIPDPDGAYTPLDGTTPGSRTRWLEHVYADDICITQLDGDPGLWDQALSAGRVDAAAMTCTSSQPSLIAHMLGALDVHQGHRVLEAGTGTGYNAALLCHRTDESRVATIDIDPVLVSQAADTLALAGYRPACRDADAADGWPECAPFDRIIATASFPRIPCAWVAQLADEGVILANLHRPLGGGALARLVATGDKASGRFLQQPGGFMPTRNHGSPSAYQVFQQVADDADRADADEVDLDLAEVLGHPEARFLAALLCPGVDELRLSYPDAPDERWVLAPDGSWAFTVVGADGVRVRQGGPRKLYEEVTGTYRTWAALGRPDRSKFGLTVGGDGAHRVWLGTLDGPGWDLPA